ncbi:MAG TPA: 3-hydroxyacyl-[acyl-carrier-protein] dehydratase FabZ [Deltaproteobacteria bacterium]|nr:3-hydroxyacyl-[acyl-carrier-protein] dehydratase FabZ [Deltaproteobacteria bacterium]
MVRNESSPPQAHQILELLPHRYPCLLIDRIVEIQRGCVVALKNVTFNEPYFQGHFPDNPVMPGVLQIEAMVKASGILATYQTEFNPQTHVMILMEMNNIKFRKPVKPGDQLRIEVTLLLEDKIFKMKGEIRCGEEIVSSAEFLAMLVPKSN